MNSFKNWIKYMVSFEGRINREKYFFGGLNLFLISWLGAFLLGFLLTLVGIEGDLLGAIVIAFLIPILISSVALIIRRLHDLNLSGWMSLLLFVPLVGFGLAVILVFAIGTKGENRYGEDPLGRKPEKKTKKPKLEEIPSISMKEKLLRAKEYILSHKHQVAYSVLAIALVILSFKSWNLAQANRDLKEHNWNLALTSENEKLSYESRIGDLEYENQSLNDDNTSLATLSELNRAAYDLMSTVAGNIEGYMAELDSILLDYDTLVSNYCVVIDQANFNYQYGAINSRYQTVKGEYNSMSQALEEAATERYSS